MHTNNKYFKKQKKIPIDKFFDDVLYNKNYGYYTNNYPFEKNGDFITAPSISSLFGEMIAIWIISYWMYLGKPKKFNIVELGPGNGKLAQNLLKTFKCFPEFYAIKNLYLYEKSNFLIKIQKKNLLNNKIKWISNFKKIKNGPVIFIGNEFFDALPVKQFMRKKLSLFENHVSLDNNNSIKENWLRASILSKKKIKNFKTLNQLSFIEYPQIGFKVIDPIINKIKKLGGGILLIDYGYNKKNNFSTIQSIKNHKKNKIFDNLGKADVTSLVNFGLLKEHFIKKKLNVKNAVTQSFFLKKVGILERAERLSLKMNFKDKSDLYFRLERLLSKKHMGELFKLIFAHKGKKGSILGFN
jgi:cyclopropane-fatty-acyl-phospholipid synthase